MPGLPGMDQPTRSTKTQLWNPLLAGLVNQSNPAISPMTNLGLNLGGFSDSALAATGVGCVVACPALPGDTFTRVSIFGGGGAEATGTHAWAALYAGNPTGAGSTLLDKSTDFTAAAAIGASGRFDFTGFAGVTLTGPTTATSGAGPSCPNGFIYVMIVVVATTIPTVLAMATPTTVNYAWTSSGPAFLAGTAGSALTNPASAPATLTGIAARATAPVVVLT